MKKLPIGIQTFADIRQGDFVYIDKTPHVHALTKSPKGFYFLSRPRRFGKSLFLDTLHQLFACEKKLFQGLFIEDKWDWDHPYPVIKISCGGGMMRSLKDLADKFEEIFRNNCRELGVECGYELSDRRCFAELIRRTHEKYGRQVVILVDEYDKPILDQIERPELAAELRDTLKDFYSVIKDSDQHVRFVFLTGVSKFSKVSIFSGLNNLEDITIDKRYATICGYTHEDVQHHFARHLAGVDMEELRLWYNGYQWLGEPVYNPFDILLFIAKGHMFSSYWFETGSPAFLIKLFQKNRYFLPELEVIVVGEDILSSFDVDRINPVTLLFQTGYLTIRQVRTRRNKPIFTLGCPNLEVRFSLSDSLIDSYSGLVTEKAPLQDSLADTLAKGDLAGLEKQIFRLFAAIPYRNFIARDLPEFEGYYASVLYAFFASLGLSIVPEDITNQGQVDLTVSYENHIYVMEIKVTAAAETRGNPALKQIKKRGYAEKYLGRPGITVH